MAYSGGADSTALLVAVYRWALRHLRGEPLYVFHVHHGLQAAADEFESHCAGFCAQLSGPVDLRFHSKRVRATARRGESPEDVARQARYRALGELARFNGVATVLLAQHADDQAETVLLALTRGAGLPGLAAMPEQQQRDGICFVRPLLSVRAATLREDLQARHIPFITDPSNADVRYTRNRIRAELMPVLEESFPGCQESFARTARHAAAAQLLLIERADEDLAQLRLSSGGLSLPGLRRLSALRRANALRRWLQQDYEATASAAQLDELVLQIADSDRHGAPRCMSLSVAGGSVLRRGEALIFHPPR